MSVTSRYVQPLAGRVAVSGGILAVEAQKIIRAAPGMGTMASAFAGQPFYEIFNFEVSQRKENMVTPHRPAPGLRPCASWGSTCDPAACPVTWPAPFCLAANPAT